MSGTDEIFALQLSRWTLPVPSRDLNAAWQDIAHEMSSQNYFIFFLKNVKLKPLSVANIELLLLSSVTLYHNFHCPCHRRSHWMRLLSLSVLLLSSLSRVTNLRLMYFFIENTILNIVAAKTKCVLTFTK